MVVLRKWHLDIELHSRWFLFFPTLILVSSIKFVLLFFSLYEASRPGGQIRKADDLDQDAVGAISDRVKRNKFKKIFDDLDETCDDPDLVKIKELYDEAKKDKSGQKQENINKLINATLKREDGKLTLQKKSPYVTQMFFQRDKKYYNQESGGAHGDFTSEFSQFDFQVWF